MLSNYRKKKSEDNTSKSEQNTKSNNKSSKNNNKKGGQDKEDKAYSDWLNEVTRRQLLRVVNGCTVVHYDKYRNSQFKHRFFLNKALACKYEYRTFNNFLEKFPLKGEQITAAGAKLDVPVSEVDNFASQHTHPDVASVRKVFSAYSIKNLSYKSLGRSIRIYASENMIEIVSSIIFRYTTINKTFLAEVLPLQCSAKMNKNYFNVSIQSYGTPVLSGRMPFDIVYYMGLNFSNEADQIASLVGETVVINGLTKNIVAIPDKRDDEPIINFPTEVKTSVETVGKFIIMRIYPNIEIESIKTKIVPREHMLQTREFAYIDDNLGFMDSSSIWMYRFCKRKAPSSVVSDIILKLLKFCLVPRYYSYFSERLYVWKPSLEDSRLGLPKNDFSLSRCYNKIKNFINEDEDLTKICRVLINDKLVSFLDVGEFKTYIIASTFVISVISNYQNFSTMMFQTLERNIPLSRTLDRFKAQIVEGSPIQSHWLSAVFAFGVIAYAASHAFRPASLIARAINFFKNGFISAPILEDLSDIFETSKQWVVGNLGLSIINGIFSIPEEYLFYLTGPLQLVVGSIEGMIDNDPRSVFVHTALYWIRVKFGWKTAAVTHFLYNYFSTWYGLLGANLIGRNPYIFLVLASLVLIYMIIYPIVHVAENEVMMEQVDANPDVTTNRLLAEGNLSYKVTEDLIEAYSSLDGSGVQGAVIPYYPSTDKMCISMKELEKYVRKSEIIDAFMQFVPRNRIWVALPNSNLYMAPDGPVVSYAAVASRLFPLTKSDQNCICNHYDWHMKDDCPHRLLIESLGSYSHFLADHIEPVEPYTFSEYQEKSKNKKKMAFYEQSLENIEDDIPEGRVLFRVKKNETIPPKDEDGAVKARFFACYDATYSAKMCPLGLAFQDSLKSINGKVLKVEKLSKVADAIIKLIPRTDGTEWSKKFAPAKRNLRMFFVCGKNPMDLTKLFHEIEEGDDDALLDLGDDTAELISYEGRTYWVDEDFSQFESSQNKHWLELQYLFMLTIFNDSKEIQLWVKETKKALAKKPYVAICKELVRRMKIKIFRRSGGTDTCSGNSFSSMIAKLVVRTLAEYHGYKEDLVRIIYNALGFTLSEHHKRKSIHDLRFLSLRTYRLRKSYTVDGQDLEYILAPTISSFLQKGAKIKTDPAALRGRNNIPKEYTDFQVVAACAKMYYGGVIPNIPVVKEYLETFHRFAPADTKIDYDVLESRYVSRSLDHVSFEIDYEWEWEKIIDESDLNHSDLMRLKTAVAFAPSLEYSLNYWQFGAIIEAGL